MTGVPAEVLGVAHRVGSLSPGKDADIVVWFGDPLRSSAHVHRVYVNGSLSFEAPSSSARTSTCTGIARRLRWRATRVAPSARTRSSAAFTARPHGRRR
ncbi:MAG: amidohydrolase family protein [Chloroflexi bacterium]|nr:amidohydrolase family protein [Chloroflexota bacterium]